MNMDLFEALNQLVQKKGYIGRPKSWAQSRPNDWIICLQLPIDGEKDAMDLFLSMTRIRTDFKLSISNLHEAVFTVEECYEKWEFVKLN